MTTAKETFSDNKLQTNFEEKRKMKYMSEDLDSLVAKNLPGWNVVWNLLLQANKEKRNERTREKNLGVLQFIKDNPIDLQKKIERKVMELVKEEEILIDLYGKAAKAAKEREEEFKGKTIGLIEQLEKDRKLMEILKNLN